MNTIELMRLPSIGALWNKYYCLSLIELKTTWREYSNVHNDCVYENTISQDGVRAWYNVMVLTELIKMRGGWHTATNMPKWSGT
jgi:hypothetical protein